MGIGSRRDCVACPDIEWPRGRLELSRRAYVFGILNVTPDSFSDGGAYGSVSHAVDAAVRMIDEGADVIDIGGESTRPGSDPVPDDEEARRVVPVIEAIRARSAIPLSVDTRKATVARCAIDAGADIVNDISALRDDPAMGPLCAEAGAPVVLMHMQGRPRTMQADPRYDDVVGEVKQFFADAILRATRAGVPESRLILDPGIGFGKRLVDNLTLVNRLDAFAELGRPLMMAASRKSFIGGTLARADGIPLDVGERLEGTLAVTVLALVRGARLLRVHDVEPNVRAVRMAEAILSSGDE
jgi:dihydropteroate synthase